MSSIIPPWTFDNPGVSLGNPGFLWDGSVPSTPPLPPSPAVPGNQTFIKGDRVIYPSLVAGTTVILPTDFISQLQNGEVLVSAVTTFSVYSGTDPAPSAMLQGSPTILGTVVNTLVGFPGGVLGVTYEVRVQANTSLGQYLALCGYLTVVPDLL